MTRLTVKTISDYAPLVKLKQNFTLENFMALHAEDEFCWFQSSHRLGEANSWLKFFETAKKSWLKYGMNPPMGFRVRTLRAGFGGSGDDLRTIHKYKDENYIALDGMSGSHNHARPSHSISIKQIWFLDFRVLEPGEK